MTSIKLQDITFNLDKSGEPTITDRLFGKATRILPMSVPHVTLIVKVEKDNLSKNIFVDLPTDHSNLPETLEVEMEYLYIRYGTDGLDALEDAIDDMDDKPDTEPLQNTVEQIFDEIREAMKERAKEACKIIQKKAVEMALKKLGDSKNEILDEAVRYLSGVENHNKAMSLFHDAPNNWTLKYGDAEKLIKALVQLRELRNKMNDSHNLLQAINQSRSIVLPVSRVNAVKQKVEVDTQRFMNTLADHCLRFPIMHRLWKTSNLPMYEQVDQVVTVSIGGASDLANEIYDILQSAYEAAKSLSDGMDEDEVWKYRPLIEEALEVLNQDDASFAARAAEERLSEDPYEDWINDAQMVVAGSQVVALVASPAPPVALAIEIAGYLLDAATLGLEAYNNYRKSEAAKAVLDPTKCLSGEPGWGHFMLGIALEVFSLFPAGGASQVKL